MHSIRFFIASLMLFAASATLQADTIIDTNAVWRFRPGQTEASSPDIAAWRTLAFNDTAAGFTNAPAPFWYDATGDTSTLLGGTVLPTMQNNYTCIFLRKTFVVTNLSQISALRFSALVDDGFVVWINGVEVTRLNVTDVNPTIATLAAGATEPAPFLEYSLPAPSGYLVSGTNVIAVQGFNTTLNSSDFDLNMSLRSILTDTNPPVIVAINPPPGTVSNLTSITLTFSEPVAGLDADDFLIDGFPADNLSGSGSNFTFTFLQPPYGSVQIGWRAVNGVTDQAIPPNVFNHTASNANWFYMLVDVISPTITNLFPPAGATVQNLAQIEVTFTEDVLHVDAADLTINGQPATNVTQTPGGPFVFRFPPAPAGLVTVAWVGAHGITDLASPPNAFTGGSWNYTVSPNATTADLIINEFLAANEVGLIDEDGEQQGWIEILNRGSTTVNLANWSLSDDPELPGLWSFPARAMAPGEYLVVFASGKDRKAPTGTNRFHTNFKLNRNGEHLGLYSPDSPRVLVHGFNPGFPEQRNDNSYGYDTNRALRYFATPTPGRANGASTIAGVAERVHFGVSRGFFTQPFTLTLSTETPGAAIRYTTDGREPTATSTLYVAPLRVTNTMVLRATAFRTNYLPSVSGTHTYIFNASAAIRSLPVISLATATNNLYGPSGIVGISGGTGPPANVWVPTTTNDYHNTDKHGVAWERPLSAELIQPSDNSGFQVNCGIRVHGSDYTRPRYLPTDKFAYRLYFRGAYGASKLEYPFFPGSAVQSFDQIILRAGHNDVNPFIRDEMTRRLHNNLGAVNVHGNLVNLFINGEYKGFFNPTERPDENWIQSWYQSEQRWDVIKQFNGVVNGDLVEYNSLNTYIRNQDVTVPAIYQEVARRFDLTNFVDYLCLNVYADMGDWPANNWVMGRERSAKGIWRYYVWDGEWACGIYSRAVTRNTFTMSGGGPDDSGLNSTGSADIARYYQKLYTSREFRLLFADRIHRNFFNNGALTDTNISLMHESLRQQMLPVLPGYDNSIATTWIPQRRAIMMGHFNLYGLIASSNAPVFNQFGGRVPRGFNLTMSITNGGGTVYFTTNGGDPRVMFTGAISTNAVAYSGPVALGQTAVVRARTLNGTNWSAMTEAPFEVASLGIPLRITEIMYNPIGGSIYEFLELQNVGFIPVNLSGMFFEGITYTFPPNSSLAPGARLVLGSNTDPSSFATRYAGVSVFGYYSGNLNNAGERITLKDAAGNIITSVDYDRTGGWPIAADGVGPSLEVIDPAGGPDDPSNWRASSVAGGTPGAGFSAPALGNVRLNEIGAENVSAVSNGATFPDWVELFNAGTSAANIAGWSLTDDGNARKFIFPAGMSIPAGGYLVVWCDAATNTTPGLHTGFSLDRDSESLFLYDANTNRADAVSYGFQLTDMTVGRVAGEWRLTQPTPNAANNAATTGGETNLIINEWLANPPAGLPDWVELFNRSTSPVALRGLYVGTSNSIQQVTSLSFVPAGGFVQLFCDEGVGWNHLDFRLSAIGGAIMLADTPGVEFDRVVYGTQTEGVSRGRLPNGSTTFTNFVGGASPGASNYINTYLGPVINEVLARNQTITNGGRVADFVELFNASPSAFNLGGMSLSVDSSEAGQWIFPPNTSLAPNSYLVIWCDGSRPASTNAGDFNTGRSLDAESGGVYLFAPSGQLVDSVVYGFQLVDKSIALIDGSWQLATAPTPAAANSTAVALGSISNLRLNEWMANPASGPDWFELFNSGSAPVHLGGLTLTDDPSLVGTTNATRLAPLSFIDAAGFVKIIGDGQPEQGRNHVNFSLDAQGEYLRLYQANGTAPLDSVAFGVQSIGVSAGRLPDGADTFATFAGSPTPGESNYQLVPGVVVSEVLARSAAPLEDAVELQNRNSSIVTIGGWYLSDDQKNFKKFRIADGSNIGANSFTVFYEAQFNSGSNRFTLDGARGGEVWLSASDPAGNLTGQRARAKFSPASSGVSIGRIETSSGVDYSALSARTFGADNPTTVTQFRTGLGASNAAPRVGAVVINEIMYHPTTAAGDEEFIELLNTTASPVPLFDSTNTWQLNDGVSFRFPPNTTLAANSSLLVVGFDPANAAPLNAFRSRYSISPSVPIFGPWTGNLDNDSDDIELVRPDVAEGGFVPYVRVDRVNYADAPPWASGAVDGGGLSLQRRTTTAYGNEAKNWLADLPTPGRANGAGIVPLPVITQSPADRLAFEGATTLLNVAATGGVPLGYQWRFNGFAVPQATNSSLVFDFASLDSAGQYDVVVSNPGGVAVSDPARLTVVVPPEVTSAPVSVSVTPSNRVQFTVAVRGSEPITYQWRKDGVLLPGETGTTLVRDSAQLADDGVYSVTASNAYGTVTTSASLTVLARPLFTVHPLSQSVVAGGDLTLSVSASGNPLPFTFRFLRNGATVATFIINSRDCFYTITNIQGTSVTYRSAVTNLAGNSPGSSNAIITILADTDGDGLPDEWETAFGLDPNKDDRDADADKDGLTNGQEYRAGTDPTSAASFLKIDSLSVTGGTTLRFGTISNKTYTVQYTERVGSGVWQRLADVVAQPTNGVQVITDPAAATNRFYRVASPWQP